MGIGGIRRNRSNKKAVYFEAFERSMLDANASSRELSIRDIPKSSRRRKFREREGSVVSASLNRRARRRRRKKRSVDIID